MQSTGRKELWPQQRKSIRRQTTLYVPRTEYEMELAAQPLLHYNLHCLNSRPSANRGWALAGGLATRGWATRSMRDPDVVVVAGDFVPHVH